MKTNFFNPEQARAKFFDSSLKTPFVLVGDKAIRFTNVIFTEGSTGNDWYLVVNPKGKYLFLVVGYEPDCDGSYYWSTFTNESISLNDFDVNSEYYWNGTELFKLLQILAE